jgi:hypothetical protein
MKRIIVFLALLFFVLGCNNKKVEMPTATYQAPTMKEVGSSGGSDNP